MSGVTGEGIELAEVIKDIRRRASSAGRSGYVMIGIVTVIGIATAYVFLLWSNTPGLTNFAGANLENANLAGADFSTKADWLAEITRAFVRIGSVIMTVFLINILVSFARYTLRAAN